MGGRGEGMCWGLVFWGLIVFLGGAFVMGGWVYYWVGFLNIILVVFFIFASRINLYND